MDTVPMTQVIRAYRRKTASTKLNWKRDRLIKADYQPDNSQVGRTVPVATVQIPQASSQAASPDWSVRTDTLATAKQLLFGTLGVNGYLNLLVGNVHSSFVIGQVLPARVEPVEYSKFIGPLTELETRKQATRQVVKGHPVSGWMVEKLRIEAQKQQSTAQKGKAEWKPKQGQKPVVLLQKL